MKNRFLLLLAFLPLLVGAQIKPDKEWLDSKFSMFIHFGLYSELGGVWNGRPVTSGYSEQIQSFAGIFSDWYAETADYFNPVQWNADSIVALAKEAGMRSIVFTSKHHDGFCMYHSRYTDFNIVDATPYGRDLMKELADACRRGGIRFSVYFSLIDWHFPEAYPISSHNADPLTDEHYRYNLNQVTEIMTGYGPISEIWFDMGSLTKEQSEGLYSLVDSLQPSCMISGRLGNNQCDFAVMADNEYPDYKIGVPWQTAASFFNETWSYRSWQQRGSEEAKFDEKVKSLVRVVSRGGNFLLNIGPKGDGSVVPFEEKVLKKMGEWLDRYGEAVYGTHANPFDAMPECCEVTCKDDAIYLFVDRIPADREIILPGLSAGNLKSVTNLTDDNHKPAFKGKDGKTVVMLGDDFILREPYSVLRLDFDGDFRITSSRVVKDKVLDRTNAVPVFGHSSLDYYCGFKSVTEYDWTFQSLLKNVSPSVVYTDNEKGRKIVLTIDTVEMVLDLDGSEGKTVKAEKNKVSWGKVYTAQGRGTFGQLREEGQMSVEPEKENGTWTELTDFEYGRIYDKKVKEFYSELFLVEAEAKEDTEVAVEVTSGNSLYMLLNGEYVTAHFSSSRPQSEKDIVKLNLKKGKNQIVMKLFNRYAKTRPFCFKPLDEWKEYTLDVPKIRLGKNSLHDCSVRPYEPETKVTPARLNNIKVEL